MADLRYRTWRFIHPDFDFEEETVGLCLSNTGGIRMVDEQASVRQAILLLLTTVPGERVMRPGYGCNLHRLVFSPNDDTTHGLAIHYVRQALQRWEPRIEVTSLDAKRNDADPGRMDILLGYRLKKTLHSAALVIPFNLTQVEV
jgi:Bacteriophage baseplate protein W